MPRAYYNEFDPFAAAWLRNLITAGLIAPGDVDERDINTVQAADLKGYTQCNFFAGIGGWSYALRLAGWPDTQPVWTGSCPCQPFSQAGARKGKRDARHLWPRFRHLITDGSPAVVFGEQVESKDGRAWLAGVRADLEMLGYAVGAADLCAASLAAPQRRQRLWWVADRSGRGFGIDGCASGSAGHVDERGTVGDVEHSDAERRNGQRLPIRSRRSLEDSFETSGRSKARCVANAESSNGRAEFKTQGARSWRSGLGRSRETHALQSRNGMAEAATFRECHAGELGHAERDGLRISGRTAADMPHEPSFWSLFDLLPCLDGKARRVEPGSFPLAHGVPARVGRLRGYGNSICPQVAAQFIQAYYETVNPP